MNAILVTGSGDRGSGSVHLTSLSFTQGGRNPCARAAPEPQPARSSNRVVGSHATPIGSNLVRLLENFDRQLTPELGGRHGCL
jgi:hypothetical protein